MRNAILLAGVAVCLVMSVTSRGATISIADIGQDSAAEDSAGVHITPTGPTNLPFVQGQSEVLGVTPGSESNADIANYYSVKGTLDQPATRLSLKVARENNSGWYDSITLSGFDNGKQVISKTVVLPPLGESTKISISAPAIDQFTWSGNGWVFHPYVVSDLEIQSSGSPAVGSTPPITPSVGSPVPEPASIGMFGVLTVIAVARRRGK